MSNPKTKLKIYRYLIDSFKFTPEPKIRKCELVKETPCFSTLEVPQSYGGTFQYVIKKHGRVFNTWEEAHNELMARAHRHIDKAKLQLQRAQGIHDNIVGMRPPTNETTTTPPPQPQ